jgi:hypothetical protein
MVASDGSNARALDHARFQGESVIKYQDDVEISMVFERIEVGIDPKVKSLHPKSEFLSEERKTQSGSYRSVDIDQSGKVNFSVTLLYQIHETLTEAKRPLKLCTGFPACRVHCKFNNYPVKKKDGILIKVESELQLYQVSPSYKKFRTFLSL